MLILFAFKTLLLQFRKILFFVGPYHDVSHALEHPDKFLRILLNVERASLGRRRGGTAHPLHKVEQSYLIIYNYIIK